MLGKTQAWVLTTLDRGSRSFNGRKLDIARGHGSCKSNAYSTYQGRYYLHYHAMRVLQSIRDAPLIFW